MRKDDLRDMVTSAAALAHTHANRADALYAALRAIRELHRGDHRCGPDRPTSPGFVYGSIGHYGGTSMRDRIDYDGEHCESWRIADRALRQADTPLPGEPMMDLVER